jgi:hypothetical protein
MTDKKIKNQKKKRQPIRTCIACRQKKPKRDLVRLVLQEGVPVIDSTGKLHGRGANICPSLKCFDKAVKNSNFKKAWKTDIVKGTLDDLRDDFKQEIKRRELRDGKKQVTYRIKEKDFKQKVNNDSRDS